MRSKNLKSATPRPAEVPPADPDVLLVADAMVLSTEDKTKFITLYHEFLAEHRPQGPTQRALVEDMVCARWRQRRCASMQTAMLNITMERRTGYVEREFDKPRTAPIAALAYLDQVELDNTLGKLTREEAAHSRTFYRALKLLRELKKEKLPNEPNNGLTPVIPITSIDSPLATCQSAQAPTSPRDTNLSPEVDAPATSCYPDVCEQARLTPASD